MELSDQDRAASQLAYHLKMSAPSTSLGSQGTHNLGRYTVELENQVERLETIIYGQRILNWVLFVVAMLSMLATGLCFSYN